MIDVLKINFVRCFDTSNYWMTLYKDDGVIISYQKPMDNGNYRQILDSGIFKLKLRNNTLNSLKTALRKFDLKSTSNKEECLERLSLFLSTEDGRNQAQKVFPKEIFIDLYETDLSHIGQKAYEQIQQNHQTPQKTLQIPKPNIQKTNSQEEGVHIVDVIKPLEQNPQDFTGFMSTTYADIKTSSKFPCLHDEQDFLKSNVFCYCWIDQDAETIKCSKCQTLQHRSCTGQAGKQRPENYVCAHCQMLIIDPLQIPIATVLRPFKIEKVPNIAFKGRSEKTIKEFMFKERLEKELRNSVGGIIKIVVRCIRLNTHGFEHTWPKYGFYTFNQNIQQLEFKLPEPPNDQKKRKDTIADISQLMKRGRNKVEIGYYNDEDTYACAIYMVKQINPEDVCQFISLHQVIPFEDSWKNAKQMIQPSDDCQTEKVQISLRCPITMGKIKQPVRGEWCKHLQCFDLQTYFQMNSKNNQRWQCPICNKKCFNFILDSFVHQILDLAEGTKETKVQIDQAMCIEFAGKRFTTSCSGITKDILPKIGDESTSQTSGESQKKEEEQTTKKRRNDPQEIVDLVDESTATSPEKSQFEKQITPHKRQKTDDKFIFEPPLPMVTANVLNLGVSAQPLADFSRLQKQMPNDSDVEEVDTNQQNQQGNDTNLYNSYDIPKHNANYVQSGVYAQMNGMSSSIYQNSMVTNYFNYGRASTAQKTKKRKSKEKGFCVNEQSETGAEGKIRDKILADYEAKHS